MTLQELGLKNGDILTATKVDITEEKVVPVPLVDTVNRCLVPRAIEIFSEWYSIYKNKETGLMGDIEVAKFIQSATGAPCGALDSRVKTIIEVNDDDKDGAIDLQGYLKFYYTASSGNNIEAVR